MNYSTYIPEMMERSLNMEDKQKRLAEEVMKINDDNTLFYSKVRVQSSMHDPILRCGEKTLKSPVYIRDLYTVNRSDEDAEQEKIVIDIPENLFALAEEISQTQDICGELRELFGGFNTKEELRILGRSIPVVKELMKLSDNRDKSFKEKLIKDAKKLYQELVDYLGEEAEG